MDTNIKSSLDKILNIIKSSEAYLNYEKSMRNIDESEHLSALLHTYQDMSKKLQKKALENKEPDENEINNFTSISLIALENEDIMNYVKGKILLENISSEIVKYLCKELNIEF